MVAAQQLRQCGLCISNARTIRQLGIAAQNAA
jgi:hypothetical protein